MQENLSGEFVLQQKGSGASATQTQQSAHGLSHKTPGDIAKNSLHFFSSLCLDPKGISIINQDTDETVHILIRQHLITNVPWILLVLLLAILPIATPLVLSFLPEFLSLSASTVASFIGLYYLSLFGYSLLKFTEWYFQAGLITNKRLIDVDMANILSKNISEAQITSVEDVTFTQKGILQSLFNFGSVFIQTEAVEQNFEFERIPHPSQVAEIISELAEQARGGGDE